MFPDLDNLINQLEENLNQENTTAAQLGKVFMMDFSNSNAAKVLIENGRPVETNGIYQKLEMYIQMLLRTEIDKFNVYKDSDFGTTWQRLIGIRGINLLVIKSEIQREIEEKLLSLNVVDRIENFEIARNNNKLFINFDVYTINSSGTVATSLNIEG